MVKVNEEAVEHVCPHHKYVVASQRKTDDEVKDLNKTSTINTTLIQGLCQDISELTLAIKELIVSNKIDSDAKEKRLAALEVSVATTSEKAVSTEKRTERIEGLYIGAAGATVLLLAGWFVWYFMNHPAGATPVG